MLNVIVLILTLLGCLGFKACLSKKLRDFSTPVALAYIFLLTSTLGTVQSGEGGLHFIFTAFNYIPVMILCSGVNRGECTRNSTWTAFLLFYAYMLVVAFTGYYPIQGPACLAQFFLNSFLSGFVAARWVCHTEGGMKKILVPLVLVGVICVLYYVRNMGALSANTLDDLGRMKLGEADEGHETMFNPNALALIYCSLIPFMLLAFQWLDTKSVILKWVGMGCLVPLVLLLVRTGSRNGALGILPCVWYFFRMSKTGKILDKYIVLAAIMGLLLFVGVLSTNKDVEHLRFFDFKGTERISEGGVVTMDTISSGRWEMYRNSIGAMSPLQKVFGAGAALSLYNHLGEAVTRYKGGNAHSIFVTVFHRTGFVGAFLFLAFVIKFFSEVRKMGLLRRNMAIMFFSIWLLTGTGESAGMLGGVTAILAGMAIGLISRKPATNSEFGEMPVWHGYTTYNYARYNQRF